MARVRPDRPPVLSRARRGRDRPPRAARRDDRIAFGGVDRRSDGVRGPHGPAGGDLRAGVRPRGPRGGGDRRGSARGQGPVDGRLGTVRERGPRQDRQRTRSGGRDPELTAQPYSDVCAFPSERFSTSSEVPASSDPEAPSDIPFLNSLEDLPSDRARSGSFFAPKRKTISAPMPTMTHSFIRTPALRCRTPVYAVRAVRRSGGETVLSSPGTSAL